MNRQNQTAIDLQDLFESVTGALRNDREYLNQLDRVDGNGNHGDNVVSNFEMVTEALRRNSGGGDAASQLMEAASVLSQRGQGQTAPIYAEGLRQAARQVEGQAGISPEMVMPFLQALLGGMQNQSGAQVGEGTMMDALVPGIMGYIQARSSGQNNNEAIMSAMGAAMRGSRQMYNQPARYGNARRQTQQPWMDPGAASATTMLEGLFRKLLGF